VVEFSDQEEQWIRERAAEIIEYLSKAEKVCEVVNPLGYAEGRLGTFRKAERHINAAVVVLDELKGNAGG
jgi:hypothetical protein